MAKPKDDAASATASEASWSDISQSASDPDKARIFVLLNGTRLLVPVPQDATVLELHEKALRRAIRFGFQWSVPQSYLQTTSTPPVVLDGEDKLLDILDLTEDNTFVLQSFVEGSSTTLCMPSAKPESEDGLVHVRWITLEEAMVQTRLSTIRVDDQPLSQNTPMSRFYAIAVDKAKTLSGVAQHVNIRVKVFLHDCEIEAKNSPSTMEDSGLRGTLCDPLDVFLDIDTSAADFTLNSLSAISQDVSNLWGIPTTKRGICALTACLKIMLKEMAVEDALKNLYELTHFPPLLLAYKRLTSRDVQDTEVQSEVRLFAHAIHLLCLQTAPAWICKSPETALECSRQVVAWLSTLPSGIRSGVHPELQDIRIVEKKMGEQPLPYAWLPHCFEVALKTASSSGPDQVKDVLVYIKDDHQSLANRIGQCLHESALSLGGAKCFLSYGGQWKALLLHKRVPPPQPTDFEFLAIAGKFRMVGPTQLGGMLSSELPVITLSGTGFVSVYDQEYYDCSEKRFFMWNGVEKKEIMKHLNPEQHLMQKLEPIITQRKKDQTWEVDAWSDWTKEADYGEPDEAIVVCIDASGSMASSMGTGWLSQNEGLSGAMPSRLDEVKEFFKNLSLRISALRLHTHLGLVTYSSASQVEVEQEVTPVKLNFNEKVNGVKALSSTAIFDGLHKAMTMLDGVRARYPKVRCRIVMLTDGGDNASSVLPQNVGAQLVRKNIVLDSVIIGSDMTRDLFKISNMTGGYAFAPSTQQLFFQIFLLETMIDIRTRPDIKKADAGIAWELLQPKSADMKTPYDFPPCRPHPNLSDYFIALADADRYMSRKNRSNATNGDNLSVRSLSTRSITSTTVSGTTLSSGGGAGGAARIILNEIKEMINNPHPNLDVYVSESNMGFWKVAMQGPASSPYAEGVFLLYIEIGQDFPLKPPSARFITPMLHPNITKHGRICHPIFDREWNGTTRIYQVLQHIYGILMSLEARDAVDPLSTLKFWTDPVEGQKEVKQYVRRFATNTRQAVRNEIVGSDTSSISSRSSESWEIASVASSTSGTVIGGAATPTALSPNASPRSSRQAGSTLSNYLAARRAPPPLMTTLGNGQNSQPVSARGLSTNVSENGGRRMSRRASFFNMFKK